MLLEFERFVLGIRPGKDELEEDSYDLTLDGRKASVAEVHDFIKNEKGETRFWGRSNNLIDQAVFFSQINPDFAEKLLKAAYRWQEGESVVIAGQIRRRVGGGPKTDPENTKSWKEWDRLEELANLGEKVAVLDYPILAVAVVYKGWVLNLGEGKRADMQGSWNYPQWAVGVGKAMLDKKEIKGVEWGCIPDELQTKMSSHRGMRVDWHFKYGGEKAWAGKDLMALASVL